MELRVGHFQTTTVKTLKLVIVFEQYKRKKNLVPWKLFPDHDTEINLFHGYI